MKNVVIVGASLAGLSSARALRSQGFDGRLTIIGEEVHRPYDRPPLSKEFLAGKVEVADIALEDEDEDLEAEWLLGVAASGLDIAGRGVVLADGSRVRADGLVIATGARARTLPAADGLLGVHTVRTLDDAVGLRQELRPGRRLVVIGAGFIGAEIASTAHLLDLDVTVLESLPTPLAGPLGIQMGAIVAQLHVDNGVRLECRAEVRSFLGRHRVEGVELTDGRLLAADVVVMGVGALPNVEWLETSGLELGNGVRCGKGGRTNVPEIVSVGDCAAWPAIGLGRHARVEHWTGALERPRHAVASLLSGSSEGPEPSPPYFWSDQYDVRIQFSGHAREGDIVTVEEGDVAERRFLAVYRRHGEPVAVLGMNHARSFTRWRRSLSAAPGAAMSPLVASHA